METIEAQHGFDLCFITEVPDYLKCIACHFVLQHPLQISTCGHKLCEPCFRNLKISAQEKNIPLSCPVDRDLIDMKKVFEDNGMAKVIGELLVKCNQNEAGCLWSGVLRDMKAHGEECTFNVCDQSLKRHNELSASLKQLSERVSKWEDSLSKKEKEISLLKFSLRVTKKDFNEKTVEIDSLKNHNNGVEDELKVMRERSESLEKQLSESKDIINSAEAESIELKESFEASLAKQTTQMKELSAQLTMMKEEIGSLKSHNNGVEDELKVTRELAESLEKQLSESKDIIKSVEAESIELKENLERKYDALNYKVMIIKDVLFCVKWKFENYQHIDISKKVLSPIFQVELHGYRFQLIVQWSGENNEYLGIYLKLHRAGGKHELLEPFNIPHSFSVVDKEGCVYTKNRALEDIERYREDCFTIPIGSDNTKETCGFPQFLATSAIDKYVVDDALTVSCTFRPTPK